MIYGGLQVDDHPQLLLQNLYNLITDDSHRSATSRADALTGRKRRRSNDRGADRASTTKRRHSGQRNYSRLFCPRKLKRLWFAAGSENCVPHDSAVDRSMQSAQLEPFKTSLFSAHVDVDQWRSYPQDDPTGIAGSAQLAGYNLFAARNDHAIRWQQQREARPTDGPSIRTGRRHGTGGSRLDVDESGLLASAELGEALANYYAARMISMVDRQMQRSIESQEEARRRNEELQKTSPEEQQKQQSSGE